MLQLWEVMYFSGSVRARVLQSSAADRVLLFSSVSCFTTNGAGLDGLCEFSALVRLLISGAVGKRAAAWVVLTRKEGMHIPYAYGQLWLRNVTCDLKFNF